MTLNHLQDPPPASYPLAIAPFAALMYRPGSAETIVEAPDQVSRMEERLAALADAATASIDLDSGTFELAYRVPDAQSFASRATVIVTPWKGPEAGVRGLRRLTDRQAEAVKYAIPRIWDRMIIHLGNLVILGCFRIIAKEKTPLAPNYSTIPMHVWNYFLVEDWQAGVSYCERSGDRLWDVRFEICLEPSRAAPAAAKGKTACIAWLVDLRRSDALPRLKRHYRDEAMTNFGVGPDQFKKCWLEAAKKMPNSKWGKPGAPRKSAPGFQSVGS